MLELKENQVKEPTEVIEDGTSVTEIYDNEVDEAKEAQADFKKKESYSREVDDSIEEVTLCETRAGNGFKVVVNGKWLYTSKEELFKMVRGDAAACKFRDYYEDKPKGDN